MSDFSERIAKLSPKKLALLAVALQSKVDQLERASIEPIAIIGMGCRVPGGARDPEAFWSLLKNGVDAITEIPGSRWDVDACWSADPDEPGKMYTRYGGFLDDIDQFDPHFFGIAPREAITLDPQHRLLLEVSWEALEHAGQAIDALAGSQTGVFVGISGSNYLQLQTQDGDLAKLETYVGTGSAVSVAAGRLSYVLGLQGPSMSIDTACSSSLVALHVACQSLLDGECRMALAGGVNLILTPEANVVLSKAKMLAPDGRCKTFAASADGYVRSEGCGVVVLKRLADAQSDGDRILAVIRGTAVNQDGRSSGLTAPNVAAQEALIRRALAKAGVAPADVQYVEAHGTGTPLGDPIEVQALASVLGEGRPAERPVLIGSVKTNLGHLEAAAGVTGLIKVVLALQHEMVPPHLHFDAPNPHIPWSELPVTVAAAATPWTRASGRRIAGLSSFGFSGTNAHAVIEEAPASPVAVVARPETDRPVHLLTLSARTESALEALAGRYAANLEQSDAVADVCFTANTGRAHFAHRLAVVGGTPAEMQARLAEAGSGAANPRVTRGSVLSSVAPPVAFLFTGQGAQYAGMGRRLYETAPVFRRVLDECAEVLRPHLDRPLLSLLYPAAGDEGLIDQTGYAQPALFAVEYALAAVWRSWGVEPTLLLGHSVGEYVAACVAGVLSLEDGLRLIAARGRLMQALPGGGAMAAVWAPEAQVRPVVARTGAEIAAVNGPASVTITGAEAAVAAACAALTAAGVRTQGLRVSHAFHSALMAPMLDAFTAVAESVRYERPRVGVVSTVTGQRATGDEVASAAYWRRQVREPVQFAAGMRTLAEQGCTVFVEVGPTPTLTGLGQECLEAEPGTWVASLRKEAEPWETLLGAVGTLYVRGVAVDWRGFDAPYARQKVAVPTYPFQRQRFWIDQRASGAWRETSTTATSHPLLGQRLHSPLKDIVFERRIAEASAPFLTDHRVFGKAVFPATASVELALAAANEVIGHGSYTLEQLSIAEPLLLRADGDDILQTVFTPDGADAGSFQLFSRAAVQDGGAEHWRLHATGLARRTAPEATPEGSHQAREPLDAIKRRCRTSVPTAQYYEALHAQGLEYGPSFQGIEELWRGKNEALGFIRLPESAPDPGGFHIHPALLDACFQMIGAGLPEDAAQDSDTVYLAVNVDRMQVERPFGKSLWAHVRVKPADESLPETLVGSLRLFDDAGNVIADIEGLRLKRASREALGRAMRPEHDELVYQLAWPASPLSPSTRSAVEAEAPGSWLVLSDGGSVASALTRRLIERGARVLVAEVGEHYEVLEDGVVRVNPTARHDFERLIDAASAQSALAGVLYLWGLDSGSRDSEPTLATIAAAQRRGCGGLLSLVQALVKTSAATRPNLWVVTRGAQPVVSGPVAVSQAPIWGLARTIGLEQPELECVLVDLDPEGGAAELDGLWAEITAPDGESQVAFRAGNRHVARLRRAASAAPAREGREQVVPADAPVELFISTRGILDNLALRPQTRQAPASGEVEVEVLATGLNFRDVLNALDMYPGDPGALGNEFAGRIVTLGTDVRGLAIGDEVIGMGSGTFSSFVTTRASLVVPTPGHLTAESAATIPIPFLTAEYALNRLARMKAGDRVLIHAATGGVGLAALQIAQRAGAEVFATAGSAEKRQYLESLGVEHIMSSRTLDFAGEILTRTRGEGIDIVLNSLAGEFIPKSLSTLRAGGRFLEIGKAGIWTDEQMSAARPDVAYFPIQLGEVGPDLIQAMLRDLTAGFAAGELRPLPLRLFSMEDAAAAFRYMAQAKHIGKIVITPRTSAAPAASIKSDATYLITGGLGALGLHVARGLVEQGAQHVVLMGRHEPSPRVAELMRQMEERGARLTAARGDITRREDVSRILDGMAAGMPPLRGVIHAAGVIDDGVVTEQEWSRFESVLAPKVTGAWLLHELTRPLPLDFFVLFSSTASLLGSLGQANYASANAFLDALANDRGARGLPALSINWGPWSESGMAASLDARDRTRLNRQGFDQLSPNQGLGALARALRSSARQVAVMPVDWKKVHAAFSPGTEPRLLTDLLRDTTPARRASSSSAPATAALLAQIDAAPRHQRASLVQTHVREQVVQVLGLEPHYVIAPQQGLKDLGMDSLMAVELRNRLQRSVGRALPSTLAFDFPTLQALTGYIADTVLDLGKDEEPVSTQPPEAEAPRDDAEPIAIIGLGCRFPEAETPEQFWSLLRDGVDAISEVPADRWDIEALFDPDPDAPGKMYVRHGGFLKDIDRFDAGFFGISPREATSLDPQQRLLLEVSWEALEHAGQPADKLVGTRSGVFVGISTADYGQLLAKSGDAARLDAYVGTGNSLSVAAGRLSYVLGLQGPSLSVDTACSSSLVALHLACQSLRQGECRLALAGGVNATLLPDVTINFCRARMLASDGRCKTFDTAADGYVRGEGAGVVVLKRLSDAVADGDRILAVIRGSAVNQDGRSGGLTVPNGPAQQSVILDALSRAGVDPAEVSYVEAHGTGTSLGDPIEMHALSATLGRERPSDRPVTIGSVKTNIGHLEAAAGIAGLIKVVLALEHSEIPPNLHFNALNPHIALDGFPAVIPTTRVPWSSEHGRRIAGVSSFGFSGTNAHVIVEEAPEPAVAIPVTVDRPLHVVALSAKSDEALRDLAGRLAGHLAGDPSAGIEDVAFTANAGRTHFGCRVAPVAKSADGLRDQLEAIARGETAAGTAMLDARDLPAPTVAFLFTGQGSQYTGMGRELYETQPAFRQALDRCAALLEPYLDRPLLSVLYPEAGDDSPLDQTGYTQPALFALEYALAELWRQWGIQPAAVMGHSVGEYVAACVAGVFSLEDALKLIAARGRLMQALPAGGAMAAVFADATSVRAALATPDVSVAAVNGPENTVISGRLAAVETAMAELESRGIRSQRLTVSHAFHSDLMDPMLDEFERIAGGIRYREPRIPIVSNLTGQVISAGEISNAQYWRRHAREAVRFQDGMAALHASGCDAFLEVGPSPVLVGMGRRCEFAGAPSWLPSLRKGRSDWEQMLESLSALYVRGADIDWRGFDQPYGRRKVALPTYPFQRERHWIPDTGATPKHEAVAAVPFERTAAAGARAADSAPLDLGLHTFAEKWEYLERLTTAFVIQAFHDLGAFAGAGERRTVDDLLVEFGILPIYRKVVARWLKRLTTGGWLREDDRGFVSPQALPPSGLASLRADAARAFEDIPRLLEYVERGGSRLVPVLTGRGSSLDTLFPDGSFAIAESLYESSASARYFNAIVRSLLESAATGSTPGRRLRVLEIGAGTGGTTAAVLPALLPDRTVYYFTDLSQLFLLRAEDRFKAYPFVRYGLLDIEQDPDAQGMPAHSFDAIVATNVLHATRDLRETLKHCRSLLAPGGVLLLNELTDHPGWFDLGLVEGWQRFDDDVRTESPVLSADGWRELLLAEGFEHVAAFPGRESAAAILGQHVIAGGVGAGAGEARGAERDWQTMLDTAPSSTAPETSPQRASEEFLRSLSEALPAERADMLVAFARDQVAAVLRVAANAPIGPRQRLMDLGLDSLMAIELRNRLASGLGLGQSLPATLMFDYPTIEALAAYLDRDVLGLSIREVPATPVEDADLSAAAARMEQMSEEEAEALLLEKLGKL